MSNYYKHNKRYRSSLSPGPVKMRSHSTRTKKTTQPPDRLTDMTPEGRQFQKAFNSFVFVIGFVVLSFIIMWLFGC